MPSIANKQVGETGLGLMGFTWRPQVTPDEQAFLAMRVSMRPPPVKINLN